MDNTAPQPTPLAQPVTPAPQVVVTPSTSPTRKRMLTIVFIILLIVAIPPTLYFLNQQQIFKQRAAEVQVDPNAIASVNGKNIFIADVDAVTSQTYASANVSSQIKQQSLDMLIERMILDDEAKKIGVSVTQDEVSAHAKSTMEANYFQEEIKYELLKEKVLKNNVKYVEAYSLGFWIPPVDYGASLPAEEAAKVAQQRPLQEKVLSEIETRLKAGEAVPAVARSIYTTYPLFQNILSVNGRKMTSDVSDDSLFHEPRVYLYSEKELVDSVFYTALFSLKDGDIKRIMGDKGAGGNIVVVKQVNEAGFTNYTDWLADKKGKEAKIYKSL